MAKGIRVNQLAKELNVESKAILSKLRDEGLVRNVGVSNFNVEQLRRIQSIAPVETLQPPYSLLAREVENEILPFCQQHGIGVIAYSPMASGLLTGAMTPERVAALPETTGEAETYASAGRS